jgi:hypothetical protein
MTSSTPTAVIEFDNGYMQEVLDTREQILDAIAACAIPQAPLITVRNRSGEEIDINAAMIRTILYHSDSVQPA